MDVECIMQAQWYSGWQLSERRLRLSIFHLSFNRLLTPKSSNYFIPHIKCEEVCHPAIMLHLKVSLKSALSCFMNISELNNQTLNYCLR